MGGASLTYFAAIGFVCGQRVPTFELSHSNTPPSPCEPEDGQEVSRPTHTHTQREGGTPLHAQTLMNQTTRASSSSLAARGRNPAIISVAAVVKTLQPLSAAVIAVAAAVGLSGRLRKVDDAGSMSRDIRGSGAFMLGVLCEKTHRSFGRSSAWNQLLFGLCTGVRTLVALRLFIFRAL